MPINSSASSGTRREAPGPASPATRTRLPPSPFLSSAAPTARSSRKVERRLIPTSSVPRAAGTLAAYLPLLLEVAVRIQDEVHGAGGLAAEDLEPSGCSKRHDGVVGPGLPQPVVDRRDERHGRAGRVETEMAEHGRSRDGHVERGGPRAWRDAALPRECEYARRAGGKGRTTIGARDAASV